MRHISRSLLTSYAILGAVLLALYDRTGAARYYIGLAFLAACATGAGLLVNRPPRKLPWILLTLGMFIWATGDVLWFAPGIEGPSAYPSSADIVYLVGYPFFIAALWTLLSATESSRLGGLLDAAMITVAAGMVMWFYGPSEWAAKGFLDPGFLTSTSYMLLDLLLVGIALRLLVAQSSRTPSTIMLALGLIALLAADLASTIYRPPGGSLLMFLMDSSWLISYIAIGFAALHPSVARDNRHIVDVVENLTGLRLILIASVSVIASLLLLPGFIEDGELAELGAMIAVALFFILTVVRMMDMFKRIHSVNEALEHQTNKARQAELRFRTIVEQTPAVTFLGDGTGGRIFTFVSPQSESVIGYTPDELAGSLDIIEKIVHEDDLTRVGNAIAEAYLTGELSLDTRFVRKDGTTIWVHIQAMLLVDAGGQTWHGVLMDITDRQRVKELENALAAEREAVERLERLDEMKNTFLQAVSHELRTPLTSVKGLAATLMVHHDDLEPEQVKNLVKRIDRGAERLESLLSDLLDVDRLSRGVFMPRCIEANVSELVQRAAEGLELDDPDRMHIELSRQIAVVDPSKVERIVENLCSNARKHTPPGTQIWVSVKAVADGVLIEVADSGPGVPDELKEAIFEPFNQGASESAHNQGLGLGLALVRKFAELHGGRAWVQDRSGGGASFKVTLPRVPAFMLEELGVSS